MDIFDRLIEEHQEVAILLFQTEKRTKKKNRFGMIQDLEMTFIPHLRAEEKALHSVLIERAEKEGFEEEIVQDRFEDHQVLESLFSDLEETHTSFHEWEAIAAVLRETFEDHIDVEENGLFEMGRWILTEEELYLLDDSYLEYKRQAALLIGRTLPNRMGTLVF